MLREDNDPDVLWNIEVFRSVEAKDGYENSPMADELRDEIIDLLAEPPVRIEAHPYSAIPALPRTPSSPPANPTPCWSSRPSPAEATVLSSSPTTRTSSATPTAHQLGALPRRRGPGHPLCIQVDGASFEGHLTDPVIDASHDELIDLLAEQPRHGTARPIFSDFPS